MGKMSLIVFGATGHVLGAFTRTGDPEGAVEPEQVVGDGLVVRHPDSGDALARVPPQHLKVETVDRRDDVILSHRDYVLEDGLSVERPTNSHASPVAYDRATRLLTLTLPAGPPEDLEAWVELDDGQAEPVVVQVEIPESNASGTATVTLAPGDYGVLVFVPTYRALIDTMTVA